MPGQLALLGASCGLRSASPTGRPTSRPTRASPGAGRSTATARPSTSACATCGCPGARSMQCQRSSCQWMVCSLRLRLGPVRVPLAGDRFPHVPSHGMRWRGGAVQHVRRIGGKSFQSCCWAGCAQRGRHWIVQWRDAESSLCSFGGAK
eukprot:8414922-Alexandrium_andersonii.AAC.1